MFTPVCNLVGWFLRKPNYTDMPQQNTKNKTGIFHLKSPPAIVVMWNGREICRYTSIDELVDAHIEGIAALEAKQEKLLIEAYRDKI
jgi:hypothetical protein